MESKILEAPLSIQIAIGAGYLGYLAAYTGIRAHHKQIDTAFITLSFGLFAATLFNQIVAYTGQALGIVCSAGLSVVLGVSWRAFGRRWMSKLFRKAKLSFSDDDVSVLNAVFADTKHHVSQVLVTLDDGRELLCQDTGRFRDAAINPVVIGGDGSVALYVTHSYRRGADGNQIETEEAAVRDEVWGDNMTIVPANRVQQIDLRFQKKAKASSPSSEEEVQEA